MQHMVLLAVHNKLSMDVGVGAGNFLGVRKILPEFPRKLFG